MLVAATIVVASCSAPKLAQQAQIQDDVYVTKAVAKEYTVREPQEVATQEPQYNDDYYGLNNPYYDMNYSTRINRFYYNSPWRGYYNDFYDYSYNQNYNLPFYNSLIIRPYFYSGWGNSYYYNNPFYGYSPYYGLNSYGYQPYWGGGYYGGGYYAGGGYYGGGYYGGGVGVIANNPNYGSRPERGRDNGISYDPSLNNPMNRPTGSSPVTGRPDRSTLPGYSQPANTNFGRPSRTSTTPIDTNPTQNAPTTRPTRSNDQPTRPSYTPPPSNSRSSSNGGSSTSSGGGRSSGGGSDTRPTRGGGR